MAAQRLYSIGFLSFALHGHYSSPHTHAYLEHYVVSEYVGALSQGQTNDILLHVVLNILLNASLFSIFLPSRF